MPTSEQDLAELHQANEDLRSQIAKAQSVRSQVQNQVEVDTRAAALKLEKLNLQAQLESELATVNDTVDLAEAAATKADAPAKTAYQVMMDEAEAANAAAQKGVDEKIRRDKLTSEERQKEDDAAAKDADVHASKEADAKAEAKAKAEADAKAAENVPADPPPAPPTAPTNGKGK